MSNDTLTKHEGDIIQYILWCLSNSTDPMRDIAYYTKDADLPALWSKFIVARHIDWLSPLPTSDTTQARVGA